ncbi:uncharacterized protein LOC127264695 [Andrographis paniculata]|uniref:uncharacterized protein LOC127264695 n=1 Tax=Andrographis paniculata TaxID=175694 RepID=UPI0021E894BF|nr:uncharacterized protein LOC127264695 [Andrographis paniculata]
MSGATRRNDISVCDDEARRTTTRRRIMRTTSGIKHKNFQETGARAKTSCSLGEYEDDDHSRIINGSTRRSDNNNDPNGMRKKNKIGNKLECKNPTTILSSNGNVIKRRASMPMGIGIEKPHSYSYSSFKLRKLKSSGPIRDLLLLDQIEIEAHLSEDVEPIANPSADGIQSFAASSNEVCVYQEIKNGYDDEAENQEEYEPTITIHPNQSGHGKKLQNLIMWKDPSKSALVFGIGAFAFAAVSSSSSSSHTWDLNISFLSVVSYSALLYLAAVFLFKSYISRESGEKRQRCLSVVGEEEAIWIMKLSLPYVNEVLLHFRALFSGQDPVITIKLAMVLFVLARFGGSICIWNMAKLGFVGIFTVPKAYSVYSPHLISFGIYWVKKIMDVWKSCRHKKAIGVLALSVIWNVCSTIVRIWTLFVLFVAFKCYQRSFFSQST